jgi:hypothetical protein
VRYRYRVVKQAHCNGMIQISMIGFEILMLAKRSTKFKEQWPAFNDDNKDG